MPKPKLSRAGVFAPGTKPIVDASDFDDGLPPRTDIPSNLSTSQVNRLYETGFEDFPMEYQPSSEEKRIQELEQQLANLAQGQGSELVVQNGALTVQGFQFSPIGLIAPEGFTRESWTHVGSLLFRLEGSIQWLIGDWLVYGLDLEYGDIKQFAEEWDREDATLHNYMSASRKVTFSLRNENVTYHHHLAITKYSERPDIQEYALSMAAHHKMTLKQFRAWIKLGMPEDWIAEELTDTPASPAGDVFAIDKVARDLKNLFKSDPSEWKPRQRTFFLGRIAELERMIAEAKRLAGVE